MLEHGPPTPPAADPKGSKHLHPSNLLRPPQIGAFMDDTMSHAPPLTSSLVYHWLYQNGPFYGCWLNMKKTITLVPDIDGMGKDALTARPGAAPGIQSEAPRYSDVRSTLHTLGASSDQYAQYLKQLSNIRAQSARPKLIGGHWRSLPAGSSLSQKDLAEAFRVPKKSLDAYYVSTYKEWQPRCRGRCLCADQAEGNCPCGLFAKAVRSNACRYTELTEIPDPNLDPEFKKLFPLHRTARTYTSPFEPVASQPAKEKMHTGHPLQFLFPEAQLSDWGRYLGASVGGSDALTDDFINKRLSSALALLPILPHLTGRTGFQILKHVIGPRGRFIPSVTHPNLLGSYAQDFDRAIGNSWLRMVGLTPDGGKLQESMLRRIKLLVSDGGSGILHMADSAPNSLVASVKEASALLAAHSPQLYHHMLSSLGSTDPLGLAHAVRQCTVTLDWLTEHSALLPKNEDGTAGSAPTHIPAHAVDLIKAKQGYSDRKLARNSHRKGLIELKIMYESDPLLFPEDQVDLMAQSAPGAGAWLALPATSTTIRDEAFHQDPSKWIVAYKAWAGVRLPTAVTNSRHLHTHGKGHTLQKSATHLTLSHLLSCTYGGHCTWRHNVVRDEFCKQAREGGMMATRECSLPGVRKRSKDNTSRDTKLTFRRTDLKTIDIRGGARHYDVAITHPTMARKDHRSPLTAAARREKQKHSAYKRYEEDYKTDNTHLVPWSEKRVIPLVAETRGGLSAHCRAFINLCASAAESLSCPGYDPKLKAELSTKFTYNIVSAIWMNTADMIVRIPLDLPRNIQKRARERSQQRSFPNPTPGLMPAEPAPDFATPRPELDLVSMHGELVACSAPVNVDSASIDAACADFPPPCPCGLAPVSVPDPADPMHTTCMSADF